jgi:hypothetical protein
LRRIHDITVSGDRIFLSRRQACFDVGAFNGKNLMACDGGITQIMDISFPSNPQFVGNHYVPIQFSTDPQNFIDAGGFYLYQEISKNDPNHSSWPSADGNFLYMSGETNGSPLQVVDISNPSNCVLVKSIYPSDLGFDPNAIIHNQVVSGNKLYVSWYTEGLVIFNISNPSNPKMIGRWDGHPGELAESEVGFGSVWGVYPFLGESNILVSDVDYGIHSIKLIAPIVPTILAPLLF